MPTCDTSQNRKRIIKLQERVQSTVYAITDIIVQQFILQIALFLWETKLTTVFIGESTDYLILLFQAARHWAWQAHGWLPIIQILLIRSSRENPM